MATGPERVLAFMKAFEDLIAKDPDHPGKMTLDLAKVIELVREDPESALVLAQGYLKRAEEPGGAKYIGPAAALAAAYEQVLGDDSLLRLVDRQSKALRAQDQLPKLKDPAASAALADPSLVHFQVAEEQLRTTDIYALLKLLSLEHRTTPQDRQILRDLRGRCVITFPIPASDPREVWEIAEVRAYMRALHQAMPYLPYYLFAHEKYNDFTTLLLCLAEESQIVDGKLAVEDVMEFRPLLETALGVMQLANALGDSPIQACVRVLSTVMSPEDAVRFLEQIADALQQQSAQSDDASAGG
jgi:hypothetical protein